MAWQPARLSAPRLERRLFRDSLLFFLAFALGCAGPGTLRPAGIPLEGKVSLGGVGAAGARVFLYPAGPEPTSAPEPAAETTSGPDGSFRLEAPEGTYILAARREGYFAFFGRNPVRLSSPQAGLHLPLVSAHPSAERASPAGEEAVAGRVLLNGAPVAGARAHVYLDLANGLRGPGYAVSEPTGADGGFRVPLTPGTYYLAARLRPEGRDVGPLQPGDRFGVAPQLPFVLHEGRALTVDVELVELPTRERMARFQGRFASLSGTVVDGAGRPLEGFRACLYDNPQMINQPAALSEPTGADGRFTMDTTLAGTFYLGARQRLGAAPLPGERVGFHRGTPGGRVELTPGVRLTQLEIVVQEVR